MKPGSLHKKHVFIALLALYAALYAGARRTHLLVMWDGCRGRRGVDMADLGGPVPRETVIMCLAAKVVFLPMMGIEDALRVRKKRILWVDG